MPNKKINQLDVRVAVATDLMLVGDPTTGTAYKSTLATLPLVPTSRTITINGVAFDLSANRAWTIDTLPSQTGNSGKYLTTNGTIASWATINLSGYVPYTGATGDVNLGTHRILAQNATIASSGSGDTFTLNHSSGSGIGLNITKGGNGEGLYVNKTSGSGNAATIIGTLNATTFVKSGGTSAQFLKADGSVDSSSYVTSNIYTSDGTLTGNRVVTMGSFTLSFEKDVLVNGLTIGTGGSTTTNPNMAFGNGALNATTTGTGQNTGIGFQTLKSLTTGHVNVAIGYKSQTALTTGTNNTTIGTDTMLVATTAEFNTAIGTWALKVLTTGNYNVGIGFKAGNSITTASGNVAIGSLSLSGATTGASNTAIGNEAMDGLTTGIQNTAIGNASLGGASFNGSNNIGIGHAAGGSLTTASDNFLAGSNAMVFQTTGSSNVAIGTDAGRSISGGGNNTITNTSIFIGRDTRALASSQTNQIVIGYQTTGLGSNTTVIGNSSTTDAAIYGRLLVNYSAPVIGTYALDVNGTARVTGDTLISGVLLETITTNRQTGSYTFVLADRGKLVEMNVAAANNLSVPLNSNVPFPIGTKIDVTQYGAGQTTILATVGVTIRTANGWTKLNAQYAAATLIKIGTDEWYLFGNLNA
jgi:hypothetical protein